MDYRTYRESSRYWRGEARRVEISAALKQEAT